MINVDIEPTNLFYKNKDANTRYVFNEGGTRSSKTYSINQVTHAIAVESKISIIFSL